MVRKTKEETKLELQLDGNIFIIEKDKNDKIISKKELDRRICLKCVLYSIKNYLNIVEEKNLCKSVKELKYVYN